MSTPEPSPLTRTRLDMIARAVAYLDSADPQTLRRQLMNPQVNLHDHWRQDPAALARDLRAADPQRPDFASAWRGAQQVLLAAELPAL